MPNWVGSDRKQRLPKNWLPLRRSILERDGFRCCWTEGGDRCLAEATDVDHIIPGDDHSPENLQSLCRSHHLEKTGRDSHWQRRKAMLEKKWKNDRRFGHQEEHAGTGQPYKHPWMGVTAHGIESERPRPGGG